MNYQNFTTQIIPVPKTFKVEKEEFYKLLPVITVKHDPFSLHVNAFKDYVNKIFKVELTNDDGGIVLSYDENLAPAEYTVVCNETGALLSASDSDGIVSALSTLLQMIRAEDGILYVPAHSIKDHPDCDYRTMMIDVAGCPFTMQNIKDYFDFCFISKIKYAHMHFDDNNAYTLPSKAFPAISTAGRAYSYDDIAEMNRYALERGIEIIPEIDVPGHSRAMVTQCPELFATSPMNGELDRTVICVGKPGLMDTLKTLCEEIIELFPRSKYLHIGGDEANYTAWDDCADCVAYMKENGIKNHRFLYTHFIKKMTDLVLSLGKTPIVWEGFPREGSEEISRDVIVTAWESRYYLAPDLVEDGFTITNASWKPLYVVEPTVFTKVENGRWTPEYILNDWDIYSWQNWSDKTQAYNKTITVDHSSNVLGGTLCAWCTNKTGYIPMKENLVALGEKTWNIDTTVSTDDFMAGHAYLMYLGDKIVER